MALPRKGPRRQKRTRLKKASKKSPRGRAPRNKSAKDEAPAPEDKGEDAPPSTPDPSPDPDLQIDQDLALQPVDEHSSEEPAYVPPPPKLQPVDDGSSTSGDYRQLLVYAAIALIGSAVLYFAYTIFKPKASSESRRRPSTRGKSPTRRKKPSSTKTIKTKKKGPPEKALKANPSNKRCFHQIYAFFQWALDEGMGQNGKTLSERFKNSVSLSSVDDPDIRDVYDRFLDVCRRAPRMPLNPLAGRDFLSGDEAQNKLTGERARIEHQEHLATIKSLNSRLARRYGKPSKPD